MVLRRLRLDEPAHYPAFFLIAYLSSVAALRSYESKGTRILREHCPSKPGMELAPQDLT
jgi:hypothetical protein